MSEEEQKLFRLYGKLPNRKDLLANKLKERKYFDSGDYALSKAGRAPKQSVGTAIPNPEMVPHAAASPGAHMGSTAQPIPGTLSPASPGAHMGLSRSPSGSRRLSTSGGSFTDSGSCRYGCREQQPYTRADQLSQPRVGDSSAGRTQCVF